MFWMNNGKGLQYRLKECNLQVYNINSKSKSNLHGHIVIVYKAFSCLLIDFILTPMIRKKQVMDC